MYSEKYYETIREDILNRVDNVDKREGSFIGDMVSPISMELETAYQQFQKQLGIMFLEDSTGEYIEKRAAEYGLYRKNGTYAIGNVTFTGAENTIVAKGSLVETITGLLFETTEDAIIAQGTTTVIVPIKAQDIGSKYNVLANNITKIPVTINGVTTVTNTDNVLGGTEIETDEELVKRTLLQIRTPATSGNKAHYRLWTLEVYGVGDAKVFPLWNGNGTVKVMPITADKRSPGQEIIANVATKIEEKRPIGAAVTVTAPQEVLVSVNAVIAKDSNYSTQDIIEEYTQKLDDYIKDSVFNLYVVDFYKCLSLLYEVPGVKQATTFTVNGETSNIIIEDTQIQVIGTIAIAEGV